MALLCGSDADDESELVPDSNSSELSVSEVSPSSPELGLEGSGEPSFLGWGCLSLFTFLNAAPK